MQMQVRDVKSKWANEIAKRKRSLKEENGGEKKDIFIYDCDFVFRIYRERKLVKDGEMKKKNNQGIKDEDRSKT